MFAKLLRILLTNTTDNWQPIYEGFGRMFATVLRGETTNFNRFKKFLRTFGYCWTWKFSGSREPRETLA